MTMAPGSPAMSPAAPRLGVFGRLGDIIRDEAFYYILTVTFSASQNVTLNIPIQSDAHFVVVSSYMNSSVATGGANFQGAGVNRGGSMVQLIDGGTQRGLSNAQVPADTIFGSAQRPFVWPFRKIFRANTPVIFNLTDTTAGAQVVDYVLGGFKVPVNSLPEYNL